MENQERRELIWAPWRMLESDHREFIEQLAKLEGLLKYCRSKQGASARTFTAVRRVLVGFESKLIPHLVSEETAVFPYLRLHAPRLSATLRSLVGEHYKIRRSMAVWKRLYEKAAASPLSKPLKQSLCRRGLELVRFLREHAQKESRLMRRFPV